MGVSGRRYYSPGQGRFFGRDPKGEKGGLNLYGIVCNNPSNKWDYLGMGEGEEEGEEGEEIDEEERRRFLGLIGALDEELDAHADDLANGGIGAGVGVPITLARSPLLDRILARRRSVPSAFIILPENNSAEALAHAAQLQALVDRLRDLRNPNGTLTQGALLVRALEASGLAGSVLIRGEWLNSDSTHTSGVSVAMNPDGSLAGAGARATNGEATCARITLTDPTAPDALASLAHELAHAAQYTTGAPGYQQRKSEYEPVAIGNEAFVAIGHTAWVTNVYQESYVQGWNKYIPKMIEPPNPSKRYHGPD